jgi:hypothetical protein
MASLLIVWTALSLGHLHIRVILTLIGLAVCAFVLEIQLAVRTPRRGLALGGIVAILASQVFYGLLVWTGWRSDRTLWGFWLTAVGLVFALPLLDFQLRFRQARPRMVTAGLVSLLISMICYLLLIWTGWKADTVLWRVWWLSIWAAVAVSCLLGVLQLGAGQKTSAERFTAVCVALLFAMIAALGLRRQLLADISPLYISAAVVPALGAVIGSSILWGRWMRQQASAFSLSKPARNAWLALSYLAIFAGGLYVGRTATQRAASFETMPSILANLSAEQVQEHLQADFERLKAVLAGIEGLKQKRDSIESALQETLKKEGRDYYRPEEDDQVRWLFVTYLSHRSALLRMIATYSGFASVPSPKLQARCFLLGFTAATSAFREGVDVVQRYRDWPVVRQKLNEAEPAWGIPAGTFDRIYENVTSERNAELCEEMAAYFDCNRQKWRQSRVWPTVEFDWLEGRILANIQHTRQNQASPYRTRLDMFVKRVKQDAYTPVYTVQSIVAEWIGDTRIVRRPPFVSIPLIKEFRNKLKPGDILLERRNWFLSNAFLPGFWPHAALYIGTIDDLRRLGIADHPEVQKRLEEYLAPAPDGEPHTVIESVSEGVIFNSLTESLHADYVAALRPRLPEDKIGQAIVRAFRHHGKPYDFEFDFFTSDKVVCTELVYRAYEGMLHFDLKRVMGRDTLPAVEIVRKFANERESTERDLDFVLFLDADPATGGARHATEDDFCASADRPKAFNE